MSKYRKVITQPGEVIGFKTEFEENIWLRTGVPKRVGKVEQFDYTTSVYENGITYNKTAYVYLPYCYDPEDKSKKYNVLYFLHGNTCEPSMFVVGGNQPMFDMLFDSGENDPCIIAFITYYFDPIRDSLQRADKGNAPSGDGRTPGIPANFYKEVIQDIIPGLEMKYNTFLKEPTDAGIIASRDHRAFSGYSRGGVYAWRVYRHCFRYFRYFCPTSAGMHGDAELPSPIGSGKPYPMLSDQEVADYVTAPIKENPGMPFFLYCGSGGPTDAVWMRAHMKVIAAQPEFSFGLDPKKNNLYYSLSDYYHTDYLAPYYLWNYLKILFKS